MERIKSLAFVKKVEIEDETSREEILKGLKEAAEEVNLIKAGKKKGQPLTESLDEP